MSDILKKPVHLAILKPSHLQKLAEKGVFPVSEYAKPTPEQPKLPSEPKKSNIPKIHRVAVPSSSYVKKAQIQGQLRVVHDSVPPISKDKQPPCDTCKTAACCRAFVVNITELEYESGIYGDAAVKITPEMSEQLNSKSVSTVMITAPRNIKETSYYLEGKIGEPCPFLGEDNRCTIYDIRPITCRVYTCVDDSRITEGMRQGTEPVDEASVVERLIEEKESE